MPETTTASCMAYELEIDIDVDPARVWSAIFDETNAWWLPEFHMVDPQSTVTFDAKAGGHLIEQQPDEGSLLWYTVHWIRPATWTVYLVGQVAPDWGGPATSHLKLQVEKRETGSTLRVSDALFGNVSEAGIQSLHDGWSQLFTEGLKAFVEE